MHVKCLLIFACAAYGLGLVSITYADEVRGTAHVIDGDTLEVSGERVRLRAIDALERDQWCRDVDDRRYRCGEAAIDALRNHIGTEELICEIVQEFDEYGRALGVCYNTQGDDLNGWLVLNGHALAQRAYSKQYVQSEKAAQAAQRGMWAGRFVAPWHWRRGDRLRSEPISDALVALPNLTPSGNSHPLSDYDDNRNGWISCPEARRHDIVPVHLGDPAYRFMRDGDGDGVVCGSQSATAMALAQNDRTTKGSHEGEEAEIVEDGPHVEVPERYVSPGIITDSMLLNADNDPNNWILYGKDYSHTRYSQLDEINTETIKDLVPKWDLWFGVLDSQGSQTMAFNGNLFVSSSYNHVFRVDGRTGRTVWRYDHNLPGDVFPHLCCDVINRGPALYGTNLYVATLDGNLVALDSASGQVIWDHTVADYKASYSFTVLPLAVDGKIIIGTSGAEFGIRGFITARDSETGEEVWKFHTIPAPGEPGGDTWPGDTYKYGGGSAWVTGAYDPELNSIYWGVGQPGPWDRHAHPGDNLYTNSTVVLDPDTGALKFHFQYTPNDPYDYDGVNETVLADIDGQKVWLHADRNGHFYSIDRTNGSFNYAVPLGKVNWNRGFDPETGRPIFAYPEMDVTRDKVTEGIYPALFGGKEWNPMAYDPNTQIAYVPAFGDHSMDLQAKQEKYTRGELYLGIKVMKWYGGGGELRAINARNGELVWVHNNPMPFRSSVTATAGNLVFAGDTEGYIKAFNATTGAQVWSAYAGAPITGGINTFTIDGKQTLTVVAGQAQTGTETFGENWKKTHRTGGRLIAFGLQ